MQSWISECLLLIYIYFFFFWWLILLRDAAILYSEHHEVPGDAWLEIWILPFTHPYETKKRLGKKKLLEAIQHDPNPLLNTSAWLYKNKNPSPKTQNLALYQMCRLRINPREFNTQKSTNRSFTSNPKGGPPAPLVGAFTKMASAIPSPKSAWENSKVTASRFTLPMAMWCSFCTWVLVKSGKFYWGLISCRKTWHLGGGPLIFRWKSSRLGLLTGWLSEFTSMAVCDFHGRNLDPSRWQVFFEDTILKGSC